MSLRGRLVLICSMLMLVGMLAGITFQVTQARQRVTDELEAATELAWELVNAMMPKSSSLTADDRVVLLARLQRIAAVRHLDIHLSGKNVDESSLQTQAVAAPAPVWFSGLVQVAEVERRRALTEDNSVSIIIRSNAAAEIAEVWQESRTYLSMLLVTLMVMNAFLYFTIGRWLAPVQQIVKSLENAEQGDFNSQVQRVSLPELRVIAETLNNLIDGLRNSKAENVRLSKMSLQMLEEERRNLALELHDEMGQALSAIKAIAWSLQQQVHGQQNSLERGAEKIGNIASGMSTRVRALLGRLRPANLDELGLLPALEFMVEAWNENHPGCHCVISSDSSFAVLRDPQRMHVYRIVQEALTNVARHAQATQVHLVLQGAHDKMLIWISDNGRGFDENAQQAGIGLSGIRERSVALGGQLSLLARPGAGVQIRISFPRPPLADPTASRAGVVPDEVMSEME